MIGSQAMVIKKPSKERTIRLGWRILRESRIIASRLFYKFRKLSLYLTKLFFAILRRYYSTILPMLLVTAVLGFPEEIRSVLGYANVWGMGIVMLLLVIRCFSLIGFSVLGGSISYLYGFELGFSLFFFGSMIGTILQFFAVRRRWIKVPGESILRKAPSPRSVFGITLVRLCPIFPYDLVTIRIAYERKATFAQFFRGTLFGSLPWFISICMATAPQGSEHLLPLLVTTAKILLAVGLLLVAVLLLAVLPRDK